MSDVATISVKQAASPQGESAMPSRFDSATSELLMALSLTGEKLTIGTSDATKRYAAADPAVTPPTSRVSS